LSFNFHIELIQDGRAGKLYSFFINEEEHSEITKFLNNQEYIAYRSGSHYKGITAKLKNLVKNYGFEENKLEPIGHVGDGKFELKYGHLRLYCFWLGKGIAVFDSGGIKPPGTRTYQDDEILSAHVENLEFVRIKLDERLNDSVFVNEECYLEGNLTFED